MNKLLALAALLFVSLSACQKSEELPADFYACALPATDSSSQHPQNAELQALLDEITQSGVVGITMAVQNPQGLWLGASGKADLHNDIDMRPCHISRVGSTVKMFTATTVLLLAEEGKINLDAPLSDYLEHDALQKIEGAASASIRQLLQHSSGVYNYIQNLRFQTASLNDLIKEWRADELMRYAYGAAAYFEAGSDVRYSNTGYILLGLLIEAVEGKPFYRIFEERIFEPLQLTQTRFAAEMPVPDGIARGYIDLYSNFQLVESTYFSGWDYFCADGGLISTPNDLQRFFRALMRSEIINSQSLGEMLSWQIPSELDPNFFPISYGLGIFRIETPKGIAYMHSGDAIGYYANMLYFPSDSTTIVYAVNSNYGKLDQFVSTRSAMENIINAAKN